jgi:PAS domain S-box-containing protein
MTMKPSVHLRLQGKLFLICIATIALVLSSGFYLISRAEERKLRTTMKNNSMYISELIRENVEGIYSELGESRNLLLSLAERLALSEGVTHVEVFDDNSNIVARTDLGLKEEEPPGADDAFVDEVLRTGSPVDDIDRERGVYRRFTPIYSATEIAGVLELVMGQAIIDVEDYERSEIAGVVELVMGLGPDMEKVKKDSLDMSHLAQESLRHVFSDLRLQGKNLQGVVERTARIEGVEYVEVIDPEGRVVAHTDPGRVGSRPEEAHARYFEQALLGSESIYVDGQEGLGCCRFFPVFHKAPGGKRELAGVVRLVMDVGVVDEKISVLRRRMAATAAVLTVAILGVLGVFLRRVVLGPVEKLSRMTRAVTGGDLHYSVDIDSGDELGELAASFNRMTADLMRSRDALLKSEEKFSKAFRSSPDWITISTLKEGRFIDVNQSFQDITGYGREEVIGRSALELGLWLDPSEREDLVGEIREKGGVQNREVLMRMKSGDVHTMLRSSEVIHLGGEECLLSLLRDITERKEAEERLKASLREKEVLLKEVHHRVKNNLQIVSSLLSLQSGHIEDDKVLGVFRVCQDRVRSMALVHERLYQAGDIARVDFGDYISRLMNKLFRSHGVDPARVVMKVDAQDVSLGVDYAVPCGLIINEVVSNSLKHAFPDLRSGEVSISMRYLDNDAVELVIADNGVGMPLDIHPEETDTLGVMLIDILAREQLEGEVVVHREGGCRYCITFGIAGNA